MDDVSKQTSTMCELLKRFIGKIRKYKKIRKKEEEIKCESLRILMDGYQRPLAFRLRFSIFRIHSETPLLHKICLHSVYFLYKIEKRFFRWLFDSLYMQDIKSIFSVIFYQLFRTPSQLVWCGSLHFWWSRLAIIWLIYLFIYFGAKAPYMQTVFQKPSKIYMEGINAV